MTLDAARDRAYLVDYLENRLRVYDARTFVYLGALTLEPDSYYSSSSLAAWGPVQDALQGEERLQLIDVNGLHPLTVSKSGTGDGALSADAGSIDCGTECAQLYPEGVEVTLTVHADPNSRFLAGRAIRIARMASFPSRLRARAPRSSGRGLRAARDCPPVGQ